VADPSEPLKSILRTLAKSRWTERIGVAGTSVALAVAAQLGGGPGLMAVIAAAALYTLFQSLYSSWELRTRLKGVEAERDIQWTPQLEAERTALRTIAEEAGESELLARSRAPSPHAGVGTIYLAGIVLENIRCFKRFAMAFEDRDGPYLTTIILGDNAAGKTTILRSIAAGLCPESDATSLLKAVPGSLLRQGESNGHIRLILRSLDRSFEGFIDTSIEKSQRGEVVRQTTEPTDFPWDKIFVCGYGTHRSSGRPTSHERYSVREAVSTLFSDTADLLNPEVVLLRHDQKTREKLEKMLTNILLLENPGSIGTGSEGVQLQGPWGSLPIAAMSDGYRSTTQWVLDYLGWQIFADRLNSATVDGVLLIDELEQHLHPRWQRHIVQRLRAQFDMTQLIASTHTPLVAAGVADLSRSQVVRLIPIGDGIVEPMAIPTDELTGKRADQVLADAFGLVTSKSPGSVAKIDRLTELISRERTEVEQQEFEQLKRELEAGWSSGDSEVSRQADRAVSKVLDAMIEESTKREVVDAHVKERLAELFGREREGP
jgi:hypothetical protein